jgi:dolichol-phosphate mannosyltransferase
MGTYQTVVEIPYKFQNRLAGDSKLSFDVTIEYLKQVIGLMKRGKRQRGVKVIRWSVEQMKAAENK